MSLIERYRELYEYEKDCNDKMLRMIDSVAAEKRTEPRFQQAVNLANHLAACRENWLDRMRGNGDKQVAWFEEQSDYDSLRTRFDAVHNVWTEYLATLDDDQLEQDFDFPTSAGSRFAVRTQVQLEQLVGHACYHRGQVALLVAQLGGETVDTDYLFWSIPR